MGDTNKPEKPFMADAKLRGQLRSNLRRLWMFSPERHQAKQNAKVSANCYQCQLCMSLVKRGSFQIDHIEPVGVTPGSRLDTEGISWDTFLKKLFCDASNLRLVCRKCHDEKTKIDKASMKGLKD